MWTERYHVTNVGEYFKKYAKSNITKHESNISKTHEINVFKL